MINDFEWQPACVDINGRDIFYCAKHGALRIEDRNGIKIYLRHEQVSEKNSTGSARKAQRSNRTQ